jgi:hypothetical protein
MADEDAFISSGKIYLFLPFGIIFLLSHQIISIRFLKKTIRGIIGEKAFFLQKKTKITKLFLLFPSLSSVKIFPLHVILRESSQQIFF